MRAFDRKFGEDFVAQLPTTPGVYLFRDGAGEVIYVGKAKNLRKRLASYRRATQRKAHRKMRAIVRAARSVEIRRAASEVEALLLENELIRALRPPFNVDGKFEFLYPALGLAQGQRHLWLCHTTDRSAALDAPEAPWQWYGAFRSRLRTREAWSSLDTLLSLLGHADAAAASHRRRGRCSLRAYRQVPAAVQEALPSYLSGRGRGFVASLAHHLLDRPRARRRAAEVQQHLEVLVAFFDSDLLPLAQALRSAGRDDTFVARAERDALFLACRGSGLPSP